MVSETQLGEYLVGAYHKLVTDCEIISYNQRSKVAGNQTEIDVIGVDADNGVQTIYVCEVVTHLDGMHYSGTPSTDRWIEFGNRDYQFTLEKIWRKFAADRRYAIDVFDDADRYVFQLWSPIVPAGYLTDGLARLAEEFEAEFGHEIELVINEQYTERIDAVRTLAASERKAYGEPAFRFLQILEHLR